MVLYLQVNLEGHPDQFKIKDYSWIPKDSPYWKDDV